MNKYMLYKRLKNTNETPRGWNYFYIDGMESAIEVEPIVAGAIKIASEPTEIGAVYNSAMELVSRMQELSPRLMPQIKFIAEKAQTTLDKEYSLSKLQEKINDEIKYLKFLNKVIKDELYGELK